MNFFTRIHKPEEENTRLDSQVAYAIGCYPDRALSEGEQKLIVWKKTKIFSKRDIEESLNEDKTEIYLLGEGEFSVRWVYMNTPTIKQWNEWNSSQLFKVQFRISPCIKGNGKVAIFERF